MTQVITATSGKILRDYAAVNTGDRIAVFPESGLDANEQASFLKEHGNKYDTIITFSPFIISDTKREDLTILGEYKEKPKYGSSVNKITMSLWRSSTIGGKASTDLENIRARAELTKTKEELERELDLVDELGDSTHKILLVSYILNKLNQYRK